MLIWIMSKCFIMVEVTFLMILMLIRHGNCMPKSVFFYYYWSFSDKVFTFQPNSCIGCHDVLPYSEWALLGLLTDRGVGAGAGAKRDSLPMMKVGTVIPYLKKIKKIYESRDTHPEFCWHQYFFTENQQSFLYQEIQI